MVTVYDVADAVGLSIASVSRALNGQPGVSPATSEKIRVAAESLGYQPNEVARSLVAKSTQTIALLLPDITNPFFPELVEGVQLVVDQEEHVLFLSNRAMNSEKVSHDVSVLRRKQVDGLIVVAGTFTDQVEDAVFSGIPTVFLDRSSASPGTLSVGVDHEAAAYDAVRHLLSLGHTKIAHIAGPRSLAVAQQREAGWRRALTEAGLAASPALVAPGDFTEEGGQAAIRALFERGHEFTAVFAANDLSAIGVLAHCAQNSISVPDDLSVIGFDGIQLSRYTTPMLTTVAQPIVELGIAAGELLLDAVRGAAIAEPRITLPTQLVLGQSAQMIGNAR